MTYEHIAGLLYSQLYSQFTFSIITHLIGGPLHLAETDAPLLVDLLLVVHDSILPGQVQELQDDGQPSGQKE